MNLMWCTVKPKHETLTKGKTMKPELLHVCPNCKNTSIGMQLKIIQEPVIMFGNIIGYNTVASLVCESCGYMESHKIEYIRSLPKQPFQCSACKQMIPEDRHPKNLFPAAASDNHNDLCPACFWKTRLEILIDAINNDHAFMETHGILKAFDVAQSKLNAMKNQLKAYHDRR